MAHVLSDPQVTINPFTHRIEGDEVIVANASQSSFLALPLPALDLLNDLAAGRSVSQAQAAFALKYGETPDMDDFLAMLANEGFVVLGEPGDTNPRSDAAASQSGEPRRYHFEDIPEHTARRLFSRTVLLSCGLLIGLALVAVTLDPALIPSPTDMVFDHDLTLLTIAVGAFIMATIFVHEMAHLVAARAVGVPARLGLSNRLWFLVAETEMTGIWLAPRRQRYVALLAGPLVDATSGALLLLILWTNLHWNWLPALAIVLCRAFLFTYVVRLVWQGYLFLRTDFYYVLATFFHCKNLLDDTQNWLGNLVARVRPSFPVVDQSSIPERELRVIRAYSVIWVAGRVLAFATLVLFTLPIIWNYGLELAHLFLSGHSSAYAIVDALAWVCLTLAAPVLGLFLWLRQLYRARHRAWRIFA